MGGDINSLVTYPIAGFGISGAESSVSATRQLVCIVCMISCFWKWENLV
jgi:hypothetical protein